MPIFFFHLRTPEGLEQDPEGIELADLDTARREAEAGAREIMAEDLVKGRMLDHRRFEITDAEGRLLLTYPFRQAINVAGEAPDEDEGTTG